MIHQLVFIDRGHWPRCLLWHGRLPASSGGNGGSLRAVFGEEDARNRHEAVWVAYVLGNFDSDGIGLRLPQHPNVW